MHSDGEDRSVLCGEQPTLPSSAEDVPTAARTIPVVRRLQLCSAVILEGTRRPGVSDFGVSVQIVV